MTRDAGTGRHGDAETRGRGDGETGRRGIAQVEGEVVEAETL